MGVEEFEKKQIPFEREISEQRKKESRKEEIEKVPGEERTEREQALSRLREEIERIKQREGEEVEMERKREEKERKLRLIKETATIPERYKELVGDDSENAWKERQKLENKGDLKTLAKSLAGVASERSQEWLDAHKENQPLWASIAEGLKGDDSEKAHEIREYLYFDQKKGRIRGGRLRRMEKLFGLHKSEKYYRFRKWVDRIWPLGYYTPGDLAESLMGCTSERSIEWRRKLKDDAPAEVLLSLAGIDEPWANEIREEYKGDKKLAWAYQRSLAGTEKEGE